MTLEQTAEALVLRPQFGMKRFRRNARLVLKDDHVIAQNRWMRRVAFPLNGESAAPSHVVSWAITMSEHRLVIVDGEDRPLVLTELVQWDVQEFKEFFDKAGLEEVFRQVPPPIPPLRDDGITIRDGRWPLKVGQLAVPGLPITMLGASHIIPLWPVIAYLAIVGVGAAATVFSGFWSNGREIRASLKPALEKLKAEETPRRKNAAAKLRTAPKEKPGG